jgi:hypothetical protein
MSRDMNRDNRDTNKVKDTDTDKHMDMDMDTDREKGRAMNR